MNDPSTNKQGSTGGAWLIGLGLLAVAAFSLRTITNSSFWMHLATGRWILQHGVPRHDMFAFTTGADQPWICATWLYDVLLFLLWKAGSGPLVVAVHALLAAAAYALLIPVARRWSTPAAIAGALAICACLAAPLGGVEPYAFCYIFPALFMNRLTMAASLKRSAMILVPAQVLWTNCSTTFVLGPAIAAVFALEAWLAARRSRPEQAAQDWRPAAVLTGLLLAATLLNPYGFAIWKAVFIQMQTGYLELRGISVPSSVFYSWPAWGRLLIGVLVIIAAGFVLYRGKLPLALTSFAVISAFLMVRWARHLDLCALLAFPFIAMSLGAIGTAMEAMARPDAAGVRRALRAAGSVAAAIAAVFVIAMAAGNYFYNRSGSLARFGFDVEREAFPSTRVVDLIASLGTNRVLHLPTDGDFLAWSLPDRSIFTDTRLPLYGSPFRAAYQQALSGDVRTLGEMAGRWNASAVLLNGLWPGTGVGMRQCLLSGHWRLAYFDGLSALLVDPASPAAALLADPSLRAEGLAALEEKHQAYRTLAGATCSPPNPPALIGAAFSFQAMASPKESAELFELLTRGAPTMLNGRVNLGIALVQSRRFGEAAKVLEDAARRIPRDYIVWIWLGKAFRGMGRETEAQDAENRARTLEPELAAALLSTNAPARGTMLPQSGTP
jgi:tetratricopeptide (TPR) repeat protein